MRGGSIKFGFEFISDSKSNSVQPALREGLLQHIGGLVHNLLGLWCVELEAKDRADYSFSHKYQHKTDIHLQGDVRVRASGAAEPT